MKALTLKEIIANGLEYSTSWAVYADGFQSESPARVGSTQFVNGGLLDGKKLICNGQQLGDLIQSWGEPDDVEAIIDELAEGHKCS